MASEASDILEYVLWLVWSCLTLTPAKLKNPAFAMILATEDVLQQLLSDALLVFAPGLLDVFKAATPPSVSYFKSLPTYVKKCWAVYLLVLEKPGRRPKIYVGSGTSPSRGVISRSINTMPRHCCLNMSRRLWTTAIQSYTEDFSVGALFQLLGRGLKFAGSFSLSKLPSLSCSGL
jgi:hypothetical protein